MTKKALLVAVCMLATSGYLGYAAKAEPTPIRQPLAGLPFSIGEWRGQAATELTKEVLAVLRVDDYTTRQYFSADGGWVGLYVGYHATQRQGASIHSPLNCLPGAGWLPVEQDRRQLTVADGGDGGPRVIEVNRVIIQRGLDRQVVLYWYQSHGRVVASEYWGKIYSVADAIRYNRTDAAMVRVIVPVQGDSPSAVNHSERSATDFAKALFPLLAQHLPS